MRINLPNALTLFRMALLPVMVMVFYAPIRGAGLLASLVFLFASITDWLDGWLARRYNLTSAFGAFLDPVADKLMVAVTLVLLVQAHPTVLLAITAAIIIGREIAVSALREWMAFVGERTRVNVMWIGKVKTIMQIIALLVLLAQHDAAVLRAYHVGEALLVVAAVLTLWSGFAYLRAAWPVLGVEGPPRGDSNVPPA